jgi:Fe-S cluster biogenesis protein NfuA/nitrite reductase/ring-hydroxylating ferredoxin subunit
MGDGSVLERVERLSAELAAVQDAHARAVGEQLTATVVDMYGEGLERLVDALDPDQLRALAADGVVGSLLLIHGLHPVPIEERVQEALDRVRPYMESHGGDVELLGIQEGVARLRLKGSCNGCGASSSTLELAVEKALEETAPDLEGLEVEGAVQAPTVSGVALPMAVENGGPQRVSGWRELEGALEITPGSLRAMELDGEALVVANVDGELLAFRDTCVSCGGALSGGTLSEGVLPCPSCERRFFLPRAGRSLDDERLQLAPVPLLRDGAAGAKVALHA